MKFLPPYDLCPHVDIQENEVRRHFQGCGPVANVRLVRDRKLNIGKGFGYVTFETSSAAKTARMLHESVLKGRNIRVFASSARPKITVSKNDSDESKNKNSVKKLENIKAFERRTKRKAGTKVNESSVGATFAGKTSSKSGFVAKLKQKKKKQKHQKRKKQFLNQKRSPQSRSKKVGDSRPKKRAKKAENSRSNNN